MICSSLAGAGDQADVRKQDLEQTPNLCHGGGKLPQREEAAAQYKGLSQCLPKSAHWRDFSNRGHLKATADNTQRHGKAQRPGIPLRLWKQTPNLFHQHVNVGLSSIQHIAMRVLEAFDSDAHCGAINVNPAPCSWSQEEPARRRINRAINK